MHNSQIIRFLGKYFQRMIANITHVLRSRREVHFSVASIVTTGYRILYSSRYKLANRTNYIRTRALRSCQRVYDNI